MAEAVTNINEVKKTSDGFVNISVEKYEALLTEAAKPTVINPPVINRTEVIKTPEMVAQDYRMWGGGLMGLGAALFTVGVFLYRAGRNI